MLSNSSIKFIRSLEQKKFRKQHGLFVVEGDKWVKEALRNRLSIHSLYATEEWINHNRNLLEGPYYEIVTIGNKDLSRISFQKNPNNVLAVIKIMDISGELYQKPAGFIIALDNIQDPGNLGTIVRLSDWFGIQKLVCSEDTVDIYNPKVVQATMGSLCRVTTHHTDLLDFLTRMKEQFNTNVFGSFMDGDALEESRNKGPGIILLGNESAGISPALLPLVDKKISIQSVAMNPVVDSLNVATAAAIILYSFTR